MKGILDAAPALLFEQVRLQAIAPGRLMSPTEVKEALRDGHKRRDGVSGWYLCGEIRPQMYAHLLKHPKLEHEVVLFTAGSGVTYLSLTQFAGKWEHRFLLPLLGTATRAFATALRTQPLRISLSASGQDAAFLAEFELTRENVEECVTAVHGDSKAASTSMSIGELFSDFAAAAVALLASRHPREALATAPNGHVCVTLVSHPAMTDALVKQLQPRAPVAVH